MTELAIALFVIGSLALKGGAIFVLAYLGPACNST